MLGNSFHLDFQIKRHNHNFIFLDRSEGHKEKILSMFCEIIHFLHFVNILYICITSVAPCNILLLFIIFFLSVVHEHLSLKLMKKLHMILTISSLSLPLRQRWQNTACHILAAGVKGETQRKRWNCFSLG